MNGVGATKLMLHYWFSTIPTYHYFMMGSGPIMTPPKEIINHLRSSLNRLCKDSTSSLRNDDILTWGF